MHSEKELVKPDILTMGNDSLDKRGTFELLCSLTTFNSIFIISRVALVAMSFSVHLDRFQESWRRTASPFEFQSFTGLQLAFWMMGEKRD